MLHLKTVEPGTLSLLKELMQLPELNDFCLVGGTALALKYGHRISIDLDLFCNKNPNFDKLRTTLLNKYGNSFIEEKTKAKFAIFCKINEIKTDFVNYPHPTIADIEIIDGIRFYSDKDIAAMKINAVLGRGVKKDFWDLYQLLHIYTLEQIISWHKEKFPAQLLLISIPNSLIYFDDAEQSPDPIDLKGLDWETVKAFLQKTVREYLS